MLLQSQQDPARIWLGLQDGLASIYQQNGQWQFEGVVPNVTGNINSLVETKDGELWAGTLGHGVYRLQPTSALSGADQTGIKTNRPALLTTQFLQNAGLPSNNRNAVSQQNNQLLLATVAGLYRFDTSSQRFFIDPAYQQLFSEQPWIRSPMPDKAQRLWMLSWNNQTGERQAGAAAPLASKNQGLNSTEYQWTTAPLYPLADTPLDVILVDEKDVIWFGGTEGLFRLDNQSLSAQAKTILPAPLLRRLLVNNQPVLLHAEPTPQLDSAQNNLRLNMPFRVMALRTTCSSG